MVADAVVLGANHAGTCFVCGKTLGFYASKWLEQGGSRMACDRPCYEVLTAGEPLAKWHYYTDG